MNQQYQAKGLGLVMLVALLTTLTISPVLATERTLPPTLGVKRELLTPQQRASAIELANASNVALRQAAVPGQIYRLAICGKTAAQGPCYFAVRALPTERLTQPLVTTLTYICGVNVYNHLGWQIAILKQSVQITHLGPNFTPMWGHLGGTRAWGLGYSWSMLTGPAPNPAWGVSTSSPASFITGGNLSYSTPPNYNYSIFMASVLTVYTEGGYLCL